MKMQYNNQFNTVGVGDPIMPNKACLTGADFADDKNRGSGDLFPIVGQSPTAYWPQSWKDKRADYLEKQKENKEYSFNEERPLLVFTNDELPNEDDYQPICGGKPCMSDRLQN